MTDPDILHVSTSVPTRAAGVTLAESAVRARLAAGATVSGPVFAAYWHEGAYETADEWRVMLRTTVARYPELEAHLRAAHPWGQPEISAVRLAEVSAGTREWVRRWSHDEPAG